MMGFAFAKPERPLPYILEVGHGIRTKSEADIAAKGWKLTRPYPYLTRLTRAYLGRRDHRTAPLRAYFL